LKLAQARRLSYFFSLLSLIFSLQSQAQAPFKILVTVDWEGYEIAAENIEEMQAFRQQFPHIPIVHLLNPVYILREPLQAGQYRSMIKSTLLPGDVQGLHLHAWKSLITYCGIPFQSAPSFHPESEHCKQGKDCGYTVSLELSYSQQALTKLLACSQQLQVAQGFDKPLYFRAGGWQGGQKLKQALLANGFVWDSSEVDAELLTTRWPQKSELVQSLKQLHPNTTPLDQPYTIEKQLKEYPNNAALADYTTTKQLVALFEQLVANKKQVMVLGFHQETAVDYLPRLVDAIEKMEVIAKENDLFIQWVTR